MSRRFVFWMAPALLFAACGRDASLVKRLENDNPLVRLSAAREIAADAAASGVRGVAVWVLKGVPGSSVARTLVERLGDPSAEVRQTAARALGNLHIREASEPLAAALRDEVLTVRLEAVASLGKIGDPRGLEPLAGVLDDPELRAPTIWALAAIGDRRAVPLLKPLAENPDGAVRFNARRALRRLG
jgi:HEAT repeat protein